MSVTWPPAKCARNEPRGCGMIRINETEDSWSKEAAIELQLWGDQVQRNGATLFAFFATDIQHHLQQRVPTDSDSKPRDLNRCRIGILTTCGRPVNMAASRITG